MSSEELKPCPFCGGKAKRITLQDGENFGGDVIVCINCDACSRVVFGEKEGLNEAWNARAQLAAIQGGMGEAVEVVAWRVTGAGGLTVTPEQPRWAESDPRLCIEPLMTVAQHQRTSASPQLWRQRWSGCVNSATAWRRYCATWCLDVSGDSCVRVLIRHCRRWMVGTNSYITKLKAKLDQAIIQREHWKQLAENRNSIVVTEVCPDSRSVEEYIIDADSVRSSWRLIREYREQIEALRQELEAARAELAEVKGREAVGKVVAISGFRQAAVLLDAYQTISAGQSLVGSKLYALPPASPDVEGLVKALTKTVASLDQLLPYLGKIPADVGLINDALVAARPLLEQNTNKEVTPDGK